MTLLIAGTVAVATLVAIIVLLLRGGDGALNERLGELSAMSASGQAGRSSPSRIGQTASNRSGRSVSSRSRVSASRYGLLRGTPESRRRKLKRRLVQAGLYRKNATFLFLVSQGGLLGVSVLIGLAASQFGLLPQRTALLLGVGTGILGIITPGLALDSWKRRRQMVIRRALPDALDVIVVCVEAGLSLPAALVRVSSELRTAHPMLAVEMTIVHREVQMGNTTGGALRNFADRFDLDEIRSLSSVVRQAERFGASIVNALRVHSEVLRRKRFQQAQERAGKATVKLLFPTVLFIFPAIFIVVLGPAAFDIYEVLQGIATRR
jgi:tight adherence protein C